MHIIQKNLLKLAKNHNIAELTLRKIGELIEEPGSPQKIKHHLDKLIEKGLLLPSSDGSVLELASTKIDKKSKIASLPILGSADCGEALTFADQKIEGYLKVSLGILGDKYRNKVNDLFVLRACGNSMNNANIKNKNIENGDYVIVSKKYSRPQNGDYVVSVIEGMANIKKIIIDKPNHQIILSSESTQELPPIYIHENDYTEYTVSGKVIDVMKKPDELLSMRDASAKDVLKELGPISKSDYEHYEKL